MSRIESGFIPLPKVEQEQPEDNLEIRLNLPEYVDQDRIGVNLTGITKLNKWGGIRRLQVIGKTEMDTSTESAEIVGVNSDGSAIASKKVTKVSVSTFESNSRDFGWEPYSLSMRWKNVGVNLNIDEMAQRVKDKPEGVRSSKNWAKELDKGIKQPIRAEGHQNMLHDLEFGDKFDYISGAAFIGGWNALTYMLTNNLAPAAVIGILAGSRGTAYLLFRNNPDYRFSLVPGYQLDRSAILSVTSRLKTVVKDLHQEK